MLLEKLSVIEDREPRSAAMNMAIDEALLLTVTEPTLRAYRWDTAAVSFGYFERYAEVSKVYPDRVLVRRWTGGGTVDHAEDFTYSLVIPSAHLGPPRAVYAAVHWAVAKALGPGAILARDDFETRGLGGCFQNPVRDDVMFQGRKVAGAAQRRTRHGLLLQGSVSPRPGVRDFITKIGDNLSYYPMEEDLGEYLMVKSRSIIGLKYGTELWMKLR